LPGCASQDPQFAGAKDGLGGWSAKETLSSKGRRIIRNFGQNMVPFTTADSPAAVGIS
jgi:hypothetical protein